MKSGLFLKIIVLTVFSIVSITVLASTQNRPLENSGANTAKIISGSKEISGYQNWTKVNDKPQIMLSKVSALCAAPIPKPSEDNPHNDKYINVFVNDLGKNEMLMKMKPQFPVGTIIVKEKLTTIESKTPELLTVMIKRKKGFNPKIGDWEFLTFNGAGTKITARGKLENCQKCHLEMKDTDYISRTYLPSEIREKLK